ncbi:hypothetical protein BHM03_00061564 [Ensete ventricosum]|nr:hypothetical protein BHM03_00061564 [Ensete ventricosum]
MVGRCSLFCTLGLLICPPLHRPCGHTLPLHFSLLYCLADPIAYCRCQSRPALLFPLQPPSPVIATNYQLLLLPSCNTSRPYCRYHYILCLSSVFPCFSPISPCNPHKPLSLLLLPRLPPLPSSSLIVASPALSCIVAPLLLLPSTTLSLPSLLPLLLATTVG